MHGDDEYGYDGDDEDDDDHCDNRKVCSHVAFVAPPRLEEVTFLMVVFFGHCAY